MSTTGRQQAVEYSSRRDSEAFAAAHIRRGLSKIKGSAMRVCSKVLFRIKRLRSDLPS